MTSVYIATPGHIIGANGGSVQRAEMGQSRPSCLAGGLSVNSVNGGIKMENLMLISIGGPIAVLLIVVTIILIKISLVGITGYFLYRFVKRRK